MMFNWSTYDSKLGTTLQHYEAFVFDITDHKIENYKKQCFNVILINDFDCILILCFVMYFINF